MKTFKLMGHEIIEKIKEREIKIEEIIQLYLERIEKTDKLLHSYTHLSKESALEKARSFDRALNEGKSIGKLYGSPLSIKGCICVKDSPTTCGSKILEGYRPPYNATVVERLVEKEGAICIGRTNMDEFAMGGSTENSCYGPTKNPWDLECVPGGSSGGSGACIAAGQSIFALGRFEIWVGILCKFFRADWSHGKMRKRLCVITRDYGRIRRVRFDHG